MTSHMEAARDAAEYDECEHGVPGGNDCIDCMKRVHADEIRALNDEAESKAVELDAIRTALGNGADEAAWPPGLTVAEAVGRLREEHHSLRDVLQWVNDQCPGKCSGVCDAALRVGNLCGAVVREVPKPSGIVVRALCPLPAGHEGPHAEALGDAGGDGGGR